MSYILTILAAVSLLLFALLNGQTGRPFGLSSILTLDLIAGSVFSLWVSCYRVSRAAR